jgi:hypothetical protein
MKKTLTTLTLTLTLTTPTHAATNPAPPHLHKAANQTHPPKRGTQAKTAWVICQTWPKKTCHKALNIAHCESRLNRHATNGQYKGIFQLGHHERKTYGHHPSNIWTQTHAAYTYYTISGFTPWTCKG